VEGVRWSGGKERELAGGRGEEGNGDQARTKVVASRRIDAPDQSNCAVEFIFSYFYSNVASVLVI